MLTTSMGRTLLDAMLRVDGDLLSLRVGEKPYVRGAAGPIEIGTRDLPAHVVYAVFEGFFPPEAKAVLTRTGRAHCVLPLQEGFPSERFSATAVQKDVLSLEIRRRKVDAPQDVANADENRTPLVLMIDDSEDQLDLYSLVLQDCYRVLLAESGPKGLRMAQAERPDLIVCDLAMPGMDGLEVCRRLGAHPATAGIPVVILTATSDSDLAQKADAVGAKAVLTKPCPLELLRVGIDDALDRVTPELNLRRTNSQN
jgi:CheY-like chemotaxis protein